MTAQKTSDQQAAAKELALALSSHGRQRMTARVLAALLFTEQPTMTMGELADWLLASSGAISGALKMLTSVGMVERVPAPGSRRGRDSHHRGQQPGPPAPHPDARILQVFARRDSGCVGPLVSAVQACPGDPKMKYASAITRAGYPRASRATARRTRPLAA
jgi:hypothetical protein